MLLAYEICYIDALFLAFKMCQKQKKKKRESESEYINFCEKRMFLNSLKMAEAAIRKKVKFFFRKKERRPDVLPDAQSPPDCDRGASVKALFVASKITSLGQINQNKTCKFLVTTCKNGIFIT